MIFDYYPPFGTGMQPVFIMYQNHLYAVGLKKSELHYFLFSCEMLSFFEQVKSVNLIFGNNFFQRRYARLRSTFKGEHECQLLRKQVQLYGITFRRDSRFHTKQFIACLIEACPNTVVTAEEIYVPAGSVLPREIVVHHANGCEYDCQLENLSLVFKKDNRVAGITAVPRQDLREVLIDELLHDENAVNRLFENLENAYGTIYKGREKKIFYQSPVDACDPNFIPTLKKKLNL